ncbi:MATE family efflux transporter [Schlesneria paludicola]|uniref:MATE family efflux transporter n=1 Tax=Schlesneria paludicola TaxID=360056 RepID=UPI00029B1DF4|nr:MATE family efflux transporter [Schlesneria paludicola]
MSSDDSASESELASIGLRRQLFLLAIPVLGEQFLTFCIGFVDVYLSGRLGKNETAAIGLSAYVSWLASMIFSLIGTGTTAVIAREWGAGRFDEARKVAGRSLTMMPVIGFMVFCLLQVMASGFARLLNMEGEQLRIAVQFLRIDACGQFFAGWTLIAAAAFRGSGDMWSPLRVLICTNLTNVAVSVACTWGLQLPGTSIWLIPPLGVIGIVVGTTTAQFCGATLMTLLLLSRSPGLQSRRLHLTRSDFGFHRETIWRVVRVGGPAALGGLCTFFGHFTFLMVIARLSDKGFDGATFAAHIVGIRIEALSYLPVEAFGIAAATLVGQALGAHHPARAKQVGYEALRQCLWYAAVMNVVFFVFAPQIYANMHTEPEVAVVGVPAFRLMSFYQIPNAILIVYVCALRGAGDTRFPLLCSLIGNVFVRVTVGYLCGVYWHQGLWGAWIGMGADNILRSILISLRYISGRWTRIRV